jgi:hypothetical protein
VNSEALACRGWPRQLLPASTVCTERYLATVGRTLGRCSQSPCKTVVFCDGRAGRARSTVAVGPLLQERRETGAAFVLRVARDGETNGSGCRQAAYQRIIEHSPEVSACSDVR